MAGAKGITVSREELQDLYWKQGLSLNEIGRLLGIDGTAIFHRMEKFAIPRRAIGTLPKTKVDFDNITLNDLYWKQALSTVEIASRYQISHSTVNYWMQKFNIPREPNRRRKHLVKFDHSTLNDLYWNQGLSLKQIGAKFGLTGGMILWWMKKLGLPRRKQESKLAEEVLVELYHKKRLSGAAIGARFGMNGRYVLKRMAKLGIARRTPGEARTRYPKRSFDGDPRCRAYLLGLRAGDFHAKRIHDLIRVQTTTTHPAQIKMADTVFGVYSHLGRYYFYNRIFKTRQCFIYCDLDQSFSFLLQKPEDIPAWVLEDDEVFFHFLTAYADCEGSWRMLRSHRDSVRYMFLICTQDKRILEQIYEKLNELGYTAHLYLHQKAGTLLKYGYKSNKDSFKLVVYRTANVKRLARKMLPISRHDEKIGKIHLILDARESWDDLGRDFEKLRKEIKESRLQVTAA